MYEVLLHVQIASQQHGHVLYVRMALLGAQLQAFAEYVEFEAFVA
jgi:hypothetical protein